MKQVKSMKDAVDNMVVYILHDLNIDLEVGKEYRLTTDINEIYLNGEFLKTSSKLAGLVDAYNYIVYGKAFKQ
jgi:hypothetical protein